MARLEQIPTKIRPREVASSRRHLVPDDEELSDNAIRAIEEGRADHAAGRTFTMDEIKRELGIEP